MSSGYNEAELSAEAKSVHRALASLQEELEAIDYYNQRIDRSDDAPLKAILAHNRDEEVEHATMLLEWLRRNMPQFDATMKMYLFTTKPVEQIESEADAAAGGSGSLGIGKANA
jgi:ferritin-like protein